MWTRNKLTGTKRRHIPGSHPGRTLTQDDIAHYQKIVVALSETIRLMKKIDEVIEQHGGWPGAFLTKGTAPAYD